MLYFSGRDAKAADLLPHSQLQRIDPQLHKHLIDDGVVHHKKSETKITAKPNATIADVYKNGELLGSGGYANVYNGTRISDGQPVAIKIIKKTKISNWTDYNGQKVPIEA